MFKHKNALISLAVVALLAACGGGGGDPAPNNPNTQQPGPGNGGDTNTPPTADNKLMSGQANLVGQVQVGVTPIDYTTFTSTGGWGFAKGTHSPLQAFGIRIDPVFDPNQAQDARVAIHIRDTGSANVIQLMIDKVKLATDAATGDLTVSVDPAAKVYVHAKTPAGTANAVSNAALATDLVSLVPTGAADPESSMLLVNIEAAMAAAKGGTTTGNAAVFAALPDLQGKYDLSATVSNIRLMNGTAELVGETITVDQANQAPVPGGGVKGVVHLDRTTDPAAGL